MNNTIFLVGNSQLVLVMRTHAIYISKGATAGTFEEALAIRAQPNSTTTYQPPESAFDEEQQYMMALAASQVRFYFPVFGDFGIE